MIRVLVVDDDALVLMGLATMLDGLADIAIVATASDGDQAAAAVDEHSPDVVLMDIRMPGLDGIAATTLLRQQPSPPEVIVLTTFDTDEHVLHALRAGASGYLLKDTPPADIVAAIRRVAVGEPILSPTVLRRLITRLAEPVLGREREARAALEQLNDREREVVIAVGQGKTNTEIAADLFMSSATVKAHVSRLLEKFQVNNRTQIALLAHDAYPNR